jgi:lysophospholipase L1-like esterase
MSTHSPSWRGLIARLGLACASVALVLGVTEVVARLSWPHPVRYEPPDPSLAESGLPVLRTIYEISRPNVRGIRSSRFYRTNSVGIRGPEYAFEPTPGVFRIVVTGDSVTMGAGVDEEDAYTAQLEGMLNAEGEAERYEVLNLGLGGINATWAMRRLERFSEIYDPHLLVYGFTVNDIEGRFYRDLRSESPPIPRHLQRSAFAESSSYLLRLVAPRLITVKEYFAPTPGTYYHAFLYNYFENPAAWKELLLALDRFAALAKRRGVCANLLVHTQLEELGIFHPFHSIYEKVSDAARERGIPVTSSFDVFDGRMDRSLWISPSDSHPNRAGHELMANALLEGLHRLPESCWQIRSDRS